MAKRSYTNIDKLGKEIDQMIKEGKTQREIAQFFGFKDKTVVHQYLKRKRKKEKQLMAGILPRRRGRNQVATSRQRGKKIMRLND